jgi:hypothetical protein
MLYSRYFSSQFSNNARFTAVVTRTVLTQRTAEKLMGRKDDKDKNNRYPKGI